MNEQGNKSTRPLAQVRRSRLRSRLCALALAAILCCIAVPIGALADENPPDPPGLSEETQPSEPSDSSEDAGSDASADAETDGDQSADDGSEASENPIEDADANDSSEASTPADESPSDVETPDATPSTQTESGKASQPADASAESNPSEKDEMNSDSDSADSTAEEETDNRDGKVKIKKKTPKQEALDKLEQASAIYEHMSRLADEIDALQARYDKLKTANNEALSRHKKLKKDLKREREHLDKLKGEMSDYIVKMYKQRGVTSYLDVLCGTTSFEEFLSLWRMLEKVTRRGERELREQLEVVKSLKVELGEAADWVEEAEKEADKALAKLNRSRLTYLSLAPHAASLKMEAAEKLKDYEGLAAAQAEYDSAYAELNDALEQGLAEAGRLEGEGIFTNPCPDAEYSSGFGYRAFDKSYHLGLDMAIDEGTPYYAADDGVVVESTNGGGYNGGAGNWIVIDHGNGVVTKYMHSSVTFVSAGDAVVRGQNIGLVGNTGNSSGPHLHFQVEIDGVAVDPLIYL